MLIDTAKYIKVNENTSEDLTNVNGNQLSCHRSVTVDGSVGVGVSQSCITPQQQRAMVNSGPLRAGQ